MARETGEKLVTQISRRPVDGHLRRNATMFSSAFQASSHSNPVESKSHVQSAGSVP